MHRTIKLIPLSLSVVCLSIAAALAINAWVEPGSAPTDGSINAPINTGSGAQAKAGDFESQTQIKAPKLCIGPVCCDSWSNCVISGGGCWAIGKACTANSQCCSNNCSGNVCAASTGTGLDQNCPSGQSVTGISGVGTISCAGSGGGGGGGCTAATCPGGTCVAGVCVGSGMLPQSACANQLSTGNRRIFVTSQTYKGNQYSTEAAADDLCYNAAKNAGMPDGEARNFKAMAAVAGRDPMSLLTASQYWNGVKIAGSTLCEWKHIASPSSFFSNSGIDNPINHDQWGNAVDGATTVMTSFKANAGAPQLLQQSTFGTGLCTTIPGATWRKSGVCGGSSGCTFVSCAFGACMSCCSTFRHWYGLAWEKTTKWAYSDTTGVLSEANCLDVPRALYCVEKY